MKSYFLEMMSPATRMSGDRPSVLMSSSSTGGCMKQGRYKYRLDGHVILFVLLSTAECCIISTRSKLLTSCMKMLALDSSCSSDCFFMVA